MRWWPLVVLLGCGGNPPAKQPTASPVPTAISTEQRGCAEAAAGLERSTRSIREPDHSIVSTMRARCLEDVWPPAAIACFASMTEDDLGRCAGELATASRAHVAEVPSWQPLHAFGVPCSTLRSGRGTRME